MTFTEFFTQMVSSGKTGRISSKRAAGLLLIIVTCFCFIYCSIAGTPAPEMATAVIIAACTCLGCEGLFDSVSKIGKSSNRD